MWKDIPAPPVPFSSFSFFSSPKQDIDLIEITGDIAKERESICKERQVFRNW